MKSSERDLDEEYSGSSDDRNNAKWGSSNRKYSRITPEVKDRLIFLIVRNNMSIKQVPLP